MHTPASADSSKPPTQQLGDRLTAPARRRHKVDAGEQQALPVSCNCGRPSWAVVTDLCLELQAAREQLALIDEDQVALCAVGSLEFYRRLLPDGPRPEDPRNDIAFWRAKWRLRLSGVDV